MDAGGDDAMMSQEHDFRQLKQALVDADATARERGDHGLCDSLANDGSAYQSAWLSDLLEGIAAQGFVPARTVSEAFHSEEWHRFLEANDTS